MLHLPEKLHLASAYMYVKAMNWRVVPNVEKGFLLPQNKNDSHASTSQRHISKKIKREIQK